MITGLTHTGDGVGRYMGIPVFVPFTVPGDRTFVEITQVKKNFARGKLKQLHTEAPARCEPPCSAFTCCGGCSLQQMSYPEQLKQKTILVQDSLARIGHLSDIAVHATIGMEYPWHYRNKAVYHAAGTGSNLTLGFYEKGTNRLANSQGGSTTLTHHDCLLLDKDLNKAATVIKTVLNQYRVAPYNPRQQRGMLKQLILRKSATTGKCMAIFVTKAGEWGEQKAIADELLKRLPTLTSILRNVQYNSPKTPVGSKTILLAGSKHITDYIDDLAFHISATSFYQVNPRQTRVLYHKTLEYARLTGVETVVDAYSGTGTISLFLARQAGMVYGLEIHAEAIEDARNNALLNGIKNVAFKHGAVEKILPEMAINGLHSDLVVLDPPRRGCDITTLEAVERMETSRIIYVSCDSATLARDLKFLTGKGYRIEEVQPIDMFPWTTHVESVALMSKG